jgi:hypothetical protein
MSFNMAIWGCTTKYRQKPNFFEAVVGRAIGRTLWESRSYYLESVCRRVFEKTRIKSLEIVVTYPLFRKELGSPRLFKA